MMSRYHAHQGGSMDKFSVELSTLIRHFEVHNRTEGKSPNTVQWYNTALQPLYQWLENSGLPTDIGSIGEFEIRRVILHLQSKPGRSGNGLSSHSINGYVRALRAFFAWLHRKGYTEEHALEDVKPPSVVARVVEPLTPDEINRLFSSINPNTFLGARNTALISLMLDTGIRLSEAAGLHEHDVHVEERYVKVLGKGAKERIVAFGASCQRALLDYYHHFRVEPSHAGVDAFFLTIDGYPLAAEGIKSLIQRLAKSSEVERLHPHLMRHTYATLFLTNGGDVFLLQHNLGHTTLTMVQHYIHIASSLAAVRSQSFSPLDRLNLKDGRRFRHTFNRSNGMDAHIYPNAGRQHKKQTRSRIRSK